MAADVNDVIRRVNKCVRELQADAVPSPRIAVALLANAAGLMVAAVGPHAEEEFVEMARFSWVNFVAALNRRPASEKA